jgi:LacI family transcriptional regulator
VGAIYGAKRLGLDVPEALSVIGIGDFKGSRDMEPTLSTVRIPARRIGNLAGETIAGSVIRSDPSLLRLKCEISLMERSTCRAL